MFRRNYYRLQNQPKRSTFTSKNIYIKFSVTIVVVWNYMHFRYVRNSNGSSMAHYLHLEYSDNLTIISQARSMHHFYREIILLYFWFVKVSDNIKHQPNLAIKDQLSCVIFIQIDGCQKQVVENCLKIMSVDSIIRHKSGVRCAVLT